MTRKQTEKPKGFYTFENKYAQEIENFLEFVRSNKFNTLEITNLIWFFSFDQLIFDSANHYLSSLKKLKAFIDCVPEVICTEYFNRCDGKTGIKDTCEQLYDSLTKASDMTNEAKGNFIDNVVGNCERDFIVIAQTFWNSASFPKQVSKQHYLDSLNFLKKPLEKKDNSDASVPDTDIDQYTKEDYQNPVDQKAKLQRKMTYPALDSGASLIFPLKNFNSENTDADTSSEANSSREKRKVKSEPDKKGKRLKRTSSFCLFESKKPKSRDENENKNQNRTSKSRPQKKTSPKRKLDFRMELQSPTFQAMSNKEKAEELNKYIETSWLFDEGDGKDTAVPLTKLFK